MEDAGEKAKMCGERLQNNVCPTHEAREEARGLRVRINQMAVWNSANYHCNHRVLSSQSLTTGAPCCSTNSKNPETDIGGSNPKLEKQSSQATREVLPLPRLVTTD